MNNILLRMVIDDEGFLDDEIRREEKSRQKDTRDDIMDTIEPMNFKGGFITV